MDGWTESLLKGKYGWLVQSALSCSGHSPVFDRNVKYTVSRRNPEKAILGSLNPEIFWITFVINISFVKLFLLNVNSLLK